MGLSIHNANSALLLNILNQTSALQSRSMERLSNGTRINRGSDDPAGLIALQSFNAEITATEAAISSTQRAANWVDTADGALTEISKLTSEIQSLAAKSANTGALTAAELDANQAQIDLAIDSIDRIVRTTQFNGQRLLDGSQAVSTTISAPTKLTDVRVFSRRPSTSSDVFTVNVDTVGKVASANLAANPTVVSAASISVAGKLGGVTIDIAAGETLAQIRDKIIAAAGQTGVSAAVTGTNLNLQTREYGTGAYLSVTRISGDTDFKDIVRTAATDAKVTVGGQKAFVDGLTVYFNSNGASGQFTLTSAGNVAGSAGTLTLSSGGATFQLGTDSTSRSTIGVDSLAAFKLGDSNTGYLSQLRSGGTNDLTTNASNAAAVARKAMDQVATVQGRLGAFKKYSVDAVSNSLNATKLALSSARSTLNDVDYAAETADLSRYSVLMQSATSLLGVANQQSASILRLLGL